MSTLTSRLQNHFAMTAAAAAGAAVFGGEKAQAAIVYSGVVNISVNGDISGVYINMVSGATSTSGGALPGYDTNPYYGGNIVWTGPAGIFTVDTVAGGTVLANLAAGTPIGGASVFGGHGQNSASGFTAGVAGIYGVKFLDESAGNAVRYGWVRLIRNASNSGVGTVVDYAWENTGATINAGDTGVPAPGAMALLALGAVGINGRRRKA